MKTCPEDVVVYLQATGSGPELVIERPGGNIRRFTMRELGAQLLGAKHYILVGHTTGTWPTSTPATLPTWWKP